MLARLAMNTAFALKRWPRVVDWAPFVAEELAVDTVQVCLDLVGLADWRQVSTAARLHAASLADAGLVAHSTFTGVNAYSTNLLLHPDHRERDRAERWLERAIDFTAAIGAEATGGHLGALSVPDAADPARATMLGCELEGRLERLTRRAHSAGLRYLLAENLASAREPGTMAQLERILREGDADRVPIRACIDVGHQCVEGTSGVERDPYAWLERFGSRAPCIHLQQTDGLDRHWPFTRERNETGVIRAADVLSALRGGGAEQVLLVLEISPPPRDDDVRVVQELRESVDYWRAAIATPGGHPAAPAIA